MAQSPFTLQHPAPSAAAAAAAVADTDSPQTDTRTSPPPPGTDTHETALATGSPSGVAAARWECDVLALRLRLYAKVILLNAALGLSAEQQPSAFITAFTPDY